MNSVLLAIAVLVISFLLGSIPWGLVISKVFYHKDLREVGSGNIGTTNAIRALGKVGGYAVFVLDFLKGILSGLVAMAACWFLLPGGGLEPGFEPSYWTMMGIAFLGCIAGHVFTPWLGFRGGKGIACGVGCMFITFGPLVALMEIALFAILVVATRHVSAGSLAAAVTCSGRSGAIGLRWCCAPSAQSSSSGLTAATSNVCATAPNRASARRNNTGLGMHK